MQIFVIVLVVVVFVVSCNWFFPANHKSVLVLFLFTCILYCIAFLLLREAFLRMRIPSYKGTGRRVRVVYSIRSSLGLRLRLRLDVTLRHTDVMPRARDIS